MSNKKGKDKDHNQLLGNKLASNLAFNHLQDNLNLDSGKQALSNFAVPDNLLKQVKNRSTYAKSTISNSGTSNDFRDYNMRTNYSQYAPHLLNTSGIDLTANNLQSGLARKGNMLDDIINPMVLQKLLKDKLQKFGLGLTAISDQKVYQAINVCLEAHVKNILENLVRISRIRQNNFEQCSKYVDKQNHYIIKPVIPFKKETMLTYQPIHPLEIVFTTDNKKNLGLLEKFEELNSCKVKFDKISNMKLKIEQSEIIKNEKLKLSNENNINNEDKGKEVDKAEGGEAKNKSGISISFTNKNPRGRPQTRVRDNSQIKVCKEEISNNKIKASENIKKIESKITLEYFLSEAGGAGPTQQHQSSKFNDNNSVVHTETLVNNESKVNESFLSKEFELNSNEISLGIYRSNTVSQNQRLPLGNKRRILLKDYMYYLEKHRTSSIHQSILHKIMTKLHS